MSNSLVSITASGMIVLDCDGTIAPRVEEAHGICMANVIKDLSAKAGIEYSQQFFDSVWQAELGKGILNFTKQYVESLDEQSAALFLEKIGTIEQAEVLYENEYIRFSKDPANAHYFKIRNGLRELFEQAAANNIPLAVVSNANQKVLEATLRAVFKNASIEGDLSKYITVVMGKDAIEGSGYEAKPSRQAIFCIKDAVEKKIGRPISLQNSIGVGDTENDFRAFRGSEMGRIIACDNFKVAANDTLGPDATGFLTIGIDVNILNTLDIFATRSDAHRHAPQLLKG